MQSELEWQNVEQEHSGMMALSNMYSPIKYIQERECCAGRKCGNLSNKEVSI